MAEAAAFDREAHMNCKHCGSKYTEYRGKTEQIGKIIHTYYCQSCRKGFTEEVKQDAASGQWLMTFSNGDQYLDSDKCKVEVYKTNSGTYEINVVQAKSCYMVKMSPKLRVKGQIYTDSKFNKFNLVLDTFINSFDSKGVFFYVHSIDMNPQLTQEALKNEAMKALFNQKNNFIVRDYNNSVLLNDALAWLAPHLGLRVKKNGCYVATCVYGSYDCPEVWTLRRFRDQTLAASWYGRAFIRLYYAVSPTLVKWFGRTAWFQRFWKQHLDHMVAGLQAKGVESTRYSDTPW